MNPIKVADIKIDDLNNELKCLLVIDTKGIASDEEATEHYNGTQRLDVTLVDKLESIKQLVARLISVANNT